MLRRNISFTLSLSRKSFAEIVINSARKEKFHPVRGVPNAENGLITVFQYSEKPNYLPSFPYEVKTCAMKIAIYNSFLFFPARWFSSINLSLFSGEISTFFPYIPAAVFLFQFAKIMNYAAKMITGIKLQSNGTHVELTFKNFWQPLVVPINDITAKQELTFFQQTFEEPYLFPIEIDFTAKHGKYSLLSKQTYYIYGDDHSCVKHGELFRAIVEGRQIELE